MPLVKKFTVNTKDLKPKVLSIADDQSFFVQEGERVRDIELPLSAPHFAPRKYVFALGAKPVNPRVPIAVGHEYL
jgi:hypothetical protein